jgi:phosphatidylcholine synthase
MSSPPVAQQQQQPPPPRAPTALGQTLAWAVHFYTGSGAVLAFAGTLSVLHADYRQAFLWMAAATFIDATDGILARLARVKETLPTFDGARLDDIVDYLTYVFLPILLLYHAGYLPSALGIPVAAAVLLSSGYGFASADAKTSDHFFTGFPSYWNVVAVYLYAAALPPAVNAAILVAFAVLVFVRIGYVYPSRTPVLRSLTVVLGVIWAGMVLAMIVALPVVSNWLLYGSLFFPVYYAVLSLWLHSRRMA